MRIFKPIPNRIIRDDQHCYTCGETIKAYGTSYRQAKINLAAVVKMHKCGEGADERT